MADQTPPRRTLAQKLDHLFATVRPGGRGEYTHEEVATAIARAGGPTISATYIWQLRRGLRDNPTKKHLEVLAQFFGVPVTYFFDDQAAEQVDAELEVLSALRDASVRDIALRAAGLSTEGLGLITEMIERVRRLEGVEESPPAASSRQGRRRQRPGGKAGEQDGPAASS